MISAEVQKNAEEAAERLLNKMFAVAQPREIKILAEALIDTAKTERDRVIGMLPGPIGSTFKAKLREGRE